MNKFNCVLLAAGLMCVTTLAFADHDSDRKAMQSAMMSAIDANGDGLISKDEFMNFHAAMWDKLPKDKNGMVAMKDMHHMHHDTMHKGCEEMKDKKTD
jgi:hypothetical protein